MSERIQEIIEGLRIAAGAELFGHEQAIVNKTMLLEAADLLETLQRERKEHHDWTPCAEGNRLPKDFEQCLISYRICDQWRVEEAWMRNGKWCTRYGIISSLDRIDAWMPKPTPYNTDYNANADHIVDTNKKMEVNADDHK